MISVKSGLYGLTRLLRLYNLVHFSYRNLALVIGTAESKYGKLKEPQTSMEKAMQREKLERLSVKYEAGKPVQTCSRHFADVMLVDGKCIAPVSSKPRCARGCKKVSYKVVFDRCRIKANASAAPQG